MDGRTIIDSADAKTTNDAILTDSSIDLDDSHCSKSADDRLLGRGAVRSKLHLAPARPTNDARSGPGRKLARRDAGMAGVRSQWDHWRPGANNCRDVRK